MSCSGCTHSDFSVIQSIMNWFESYKTKLQSLSDDAITQGKKSRDSHVQDSLSHEPSALVSPIVAISVSEHETIRR